jgi:hypothetical protein
LQRIDDLAPNMGLWWYFFALIFDHFRAFFMFVFHVQSVLLLVPLTIRLRGKPLVLALIACLLVALFKARTLCTLAALLPAPDPDSRACMRARAVVHIRRRFGCAGCLAAGGEA